MTTPTGGGNLGKAEGEIVLTYRDKGTKAAERDLESLGRTAKNQSKSVENVGKGMAAAGAIIAGGFALAVRSAAQFEKQLSNIEAVSDATQSQMDDVRLKALQLGKDTVFSAAESAAAMEELIKAGLTVEEVLNGAADATVALAAAGEVSMPEAATIASNAMNQFGIEAENMVNVANQIAGAANASAIDVRQFGFSLSQAGAVANLAGANFDDTATAIALLGNAGIVGSDAGTSLKSMLNNLNPVTEKQINLARELGILTKDGTNAFYDQTGSLKDLNQVSEILKKSLEGMTDQQKQMKLEILFGSDAIRAAAVLAEEGAEGFDAMVAAMARVSAADVAATKMDNLNGSIEQLKGSFETLMITVGTPFLGAVRRVVDVLNSVVGVFLELPGPIQDLIGLAAVLSSSFLLISGGLIVLLPKIAEYRKGLQALAATALWQRIASGVSLVTSAMGPWGKALTIGAAVLGALLFMTKKAKPPMDDFTDSIDANADALSAQNRAAAAAEYDNAGFLQVAKDLGISLTDLTDATLGDVDAQERLTAAIDSQRSAIQKNIDSLLIQRAASGAQNVEVERALELADGQLRSLDKLSSAYEYSAGNFRKATEANKLQNEATRGGTAANDAAVAAQTRINEAMGMTPEKARAAAESTVILKGDVNNLGRTAAETEADMKLLNDSIKALLETAFGAPRSLDAFQRKLNALKGTAKENGTSLKGTTDKVIENRAAFYDAADALAAYAQKQLETRPPAEVAAEVENLTDKIYREGRAAGFSADEIDKVIGKIKALPKTVDPTFVDVDTATANAKLEAIRTGIERIPGSKTVKITAIYQNMGDDVNVPGYAKGGLVKRKTLAFVAENGPELIIPTQGNVMENFLRIASAQRVANVVPEATVTSNRGPVTQAQREPSNLRLLKGSLDISPSGRAFLTGVAQDVYEGEDQFATTYGRMG